jgi:hypothetical protein
MAATNGTSWPGVLLDDMLLEHRPISGESNAEKIGRNCSLLLLIEVWNVNLYPIPRPKALVLEPRG